MERGQAQREGCAAPTDPGMAGARGSRRDQGHLCHPGTPLPPRSFSRCTKIALGIFLDQENVLHLGIKTSVSFYSLFFAQ